MSKNKKLNPIDMASNIELFDSDYESFDFTSKNAHSKIKIKA